MLSEVHSRMARPPAPCSGLHNQVPSAGGTVPFGVQRASAGRSAACNRELSHQGSRERASAPGPLPKSGRLWAIRRVGHLLDEIRLRGETAEVRDEVVRLAKRYGILTPYTSYLVLESEEATRARYLAQLAQERIPTKE